MSGYELVEPSMEYRDEYLDMIREWMETGENMVPFVLKFDCADFDAFLRELHRLKTGSDLGSGKVNSSTYWLVNADRRVLGAVNIRHTLNEQLLTIGGHIGYGIRPSERRKGHATRLFALALRKARGLGISKALATCDKENVGSAKTILNNGGVLDSEDTVKGTVIQRYWIETGEAEADADDRLSADDDR